MPGPATAPNFQPKEQAATFGPQSFDLASFTVGVEAANTIVVSIQLKNARGKALAQKAIADIYLSDAATGIGITGTVPTSTLVAGTNGTKLAALVTDKMLRMLSDASGRIDLSIVQTAAPVTYYVVVVFPDGSIGVSSAVTFA